MDIDLVMGKFGHNEPFRRLFLMALMKVEKHIGECERNKEDKEKDVYRCAYEALTLRSKNSTSDTRHK